MVRLFTGMFTDTRRCLLPRDFQGKKLKKIVSFYCMPVCMSVLDRTGRRNWQERLAPAGFILVVAWLRSERFKMYYAGLT